MADDKPVAFSIFERWLERLGRQGYSVTAYYDAEKTLPVDSEELPEIAEPTTLYLVATKEGEDSVTYVRTITPPRRGSAASGGLATQASPGVPAREVSALAAGWKELVRMNHETVRLQTEAIKDLLNTNQLITKQLTETRAAVETDTMFDKGIEVLKELVPQLPIILEYTKGLVSKPAIPAPSPASPADAPVTVETTIEDKERGDS